MIGLLIYSYASEDAGFVLKLVRGVREIAAATSGGSLE